MRVSKMPKYLRIQFPNSNYNNGKIMSRNQLNKLNHIYLMHLEKQYGAVCERDYSSKPQKDLGRYLLNCVKNPLLSERSELRGFSNPINIDLSLSQRNEQSPNIQRHTALICIKLQYYIYLTSVQILSRSVTEFPISFRYSPFLRASSGG